MSLERRITRTRILPMTPSSCASTSIDALSVSSESRRSPAAKASPSLTFHSEMVPSVIVGDCVRCSMSSIRRRIRSSSR